MANQRSHTDTVARKGEWTETDVFGNKEDWGDDTYYNDQLVKMTREWDGPKRQKNDEGLGKDIRTWRKRQNPVHPMEQRPIRGPVKLAPFPTDRETLRVPIREDRHVVVQSFRDNVYVNIRDFYRDEVTHKWLPGKKGINMSLEDWNALTAALPKIDKAALRLQQNIWDRDEK